MNAPASALPMPRPRIHWGWLLTLAIAVAATAFLAGLVTGRSISPSSTSVGVAPHARTFAPSEPAVVRITGTGPDLIEMAARSQAVNIPVTGTGPGLALVAAYGGHGGAGS